MSKNPDFKIGKKVVYPSHGVGKIISETTQNIVGHELKLYVIDFPDEKMTLRVPVNRVEESGLRLLSTEDIMNKAIAKLKGRAKPSRGMWSRRAKEFEEKINSGNVLSISEVVRDLHKNVDDPDRSYSERVIYESALGRLSREFSAVKEISLEEATIELEKILISRKANSESATESEELATEEAA